MDPINRELVATVNQSLINGGLRFNYKILLVPVRQIVHLGVSLVQLLFQHAMLGCTERDRGDTISRTHFKGGGYP